MVRIFRHYVSPIKILLSGVDFITIFWASILGHWLRFLIADISFIIDKQVLISALAIAFVTSPCLLAAGLYQLDALRHKDVRLIRLGVGMIMAAFLLSALVFIAPALDLWRSTLVACLLFAFLCILAVHYSASWLIKQNFWQQRLLLVGTGKRALEIVEAITAQPAGNFKVVGAISTADKHYNAVLADDLVFADDAPLDWRMFDLKATMIVVAERPNAEDPLTEALLNVKLLGGDVIDRKTFLEQTRGYIPIEDIDSSWLTYGAGIRSFLPLEHAAKRVLDILMAIVILTISAPISLLVAIIIRLTSRGPVIFSQNRIGRGGQVFKLFKFRSMAHDESDRDEQWASVNDPRVTWIGRIIRPTRIDEIPQAFNVLRGDMSFVGPRPEQPKLAEKLGQSLPFYKVRTMVKPGITGWAQIRAGYAASEADTKVKLEHDLYYIKNYSIFLDLLIILNTVRVVLFREGSR